LAPAALSFFVPLAAHAGGEGFSSATKLSGEANFLTGARRCQDGTNNCPEAIYNTYSYFMDLSTSFDGEDNLKVKIESGNGTGGANGAVITEDSVNTNNQLTITELFYTKPIGDFVISAGPLYNQDAYVATTTSSYSNSGLFSGWWLEPNSWTRSVVTTSPGVGVAYVNPKGFNASATLISAGGNNSTLGIATEEGLDSLSFSVGYDFDNWGWGVIHNRLDDPTAYIQAVSQNAWTTAFTDTSKFTGIGAYVNITDSLDFSIGYDVIDLGIANFEDNSSLAFGADYDIGPGVLSAGYASQPDWSAAGAATNTGSAYELYYDYPINDGVSIKPMILLHIMEDDTTPSYADTTTYGIETSFKF